MKLIVPALGLLFCAACSPPVEVEGFPDTLVLQGACGDIVLFAADEEDTLLLTVVGAGFVAAAAATDETTTDVISLDESALSVTLDVGVDVSAATCADGMDETPQVEATYVASRGTATLTVTPSGAGLFMVGVLLEDLEFPSGSHSLLLSRFVLEDVPVADSPET